MDGDSAGRRYTSRHIKRGVRDLARRPPANRALRHGGTARTDEVQPKANMNQPDARRCRCLRCGHRLDWRYSEVKGASWIDFCAGCGWIARGRTARPKGKRGPTLTTILVEVGGPDDVPVPNPWAGIYRLSTKRCPEVVWEPTDSSCRRCHSASGIKGVREKQKQRYVFELCVECGEVTVKRILMATPKMVRVDVGNVATTPDSPGVRWLVRGLGL